jgi:hypothetical protein
MKLLKSGLVVVFALAEHDDGNDDENEYDCFELGDRGDMGDFIWKFPEKHAPKPYNWPAR